MGKAKTKASSLYPRRVGPTCFLVLCTLLCTIGGLSGAHKLGALQGRSCATGEGTARALSETQATPLKGEEDLCQRLIFH